MVINQFNVKGVIPFKSKNNSPVSPYCHGPEPPQIAFHRMQSVSGKIQRSRYSSGIEKRKNTIHCLQQVRSDAARISTLIKAFQAPMLETSDHDLNIVK